MAFLENTLSSDLPRHGGKATTVSVIIPWETLRQDLDKAGIVVTSTGDRITIGEGRRLACQAGILPAVMGGESEVLDLGRESRLFKPHQRKAMNLRDKECTTVGCSVPAEFCDAHHKVPWSKGGKTDLEDGKLLCPFHHHRAHDPGWLTHHHPNGSTRSPDVSDRRRPESFTQDPTSNRVRHTRMPRKTYLQIRRVAMPRTPQSRYRE